MIVSFHPLFQADKNLICAGREPETDDFRAIKAAEAVILPQGCRQTLYEMARENCRYVFPNYDARFRFPSKIGQIRLFRQTGTLHPKTEIFDTIESFDRQYGNVSEYVPFQLPFVFKLNWGDEGDTVYFVDSLDTLKTVLQQAASFELHGQRGFLIQEYIPNRNRALRVVIIGQRFRSYWRIQEKNNGFLANLSKGALLDFDSDRGLQSEAISIIHNFCEKTKINLAGFDIIFSTAQNKPIPYLLEINYFFGRKGLGGSEAYYRVLQQEIHLWLQRLGLKYEKK